MKQLEDIVDTPVFYDKSGKRWRITKIIGTICIIGLLAFLTWAIPQLLAHRRVVLFQDNLTNASSSGVLSNYQSPEPTELASQLSRLNVPVIGNGPLVRLVAVQKSGQKDVAVDAFNGRIVSPLSTAELNFIDGDAYALQRYGATSGKRIVLTFDDGPHPVHTPQLLDLLSKNGITATFFVTGDNVVKYPAIAQRIVREGHIIANHTFSHINFDYVGPFESEQQVNQASRVIAATTSQQTSYFRPPYAGNTDQSMRNGLAGIIAGQSLGYVNTLYTFDSGDWHFTQSNQRPYPEFDGKDEVILVHDGGGDRTQTVAYVESLIARAGQHGYRFANLDALYPQSPTLTATTAPTPADMMSLAAAWSVLVLPREVLGGLFIFSLVSIVCVTVLNIILAMIQRKRTHYKRRARNYYPFVSIIVPAYNEGTVLNATVRSLINSRYKHTEIIIVDDGSTDDTWSVAQSLARKYKKVRAVHQSNGGKSSAINNGIQHAKGSIVIGIDADTIFPPQTVTKLIRHFKDPRVGAVAGVVKVGNVNGLLTRWQALEYTLSISIERNAHALMNSIMIVPGACGAWRKDAIVEAGGLSHSTLAEDCDLTLKIQRLGYYKILQDNDAISYTEAPQQAKSLVKQRFRWTFGCIQALYKHRAMLFHTRYGYLSLFAMPYAAVSVMIPLLFWPILAFISLGNILDGNYLPIIAYFGVTLALQFLVASVGLRMAKAPMSYLLIVPFARFIYGPIRVYVLYRTVVTAVRGSYVGWNKLARTGTVQYSTIQARRSA